MMSTVRKTVSSFFRALVAEPYPGLGMNRAYWELFGYLLFGTFFDRDTGRLVIDQGLLAKIEGKPVNRYRGIDFLEAFRRDVFSLESFEWTNWTGNKDGHGKCRQVHTLNLHPRLEGAIEAERLKLNHDAGRVYFVDGTTFSRAKQAADRKEYRSAAIERLREADCDLAREILGYLNALPSHLFSKQVKNHLPSALEIADRIQKPRVRDAQLRILQTISEQPQPFYAPSPKDRTVRIFGIHESLLSLKGEIRRTLTCGCSEADLANSQLAICAKLWEIPEIEDFLASGKSFWIHLCEQLGHTVEDKARLKDAFKKPLYASCFGMPKPKVQAMFTQNLNKKGIRKGGARVLASPLMIALFKARGRMAEQIRADGGGLNCFGKWIKLTTAVDVDSILAQQAQAVELKLLYPLIKLAKEHPDNFTVLLWQHDGVTVYFQRRAKLWAQRIGEVVQREIDTLGIKTRLEWKHDHLTEEPITEGNIIPQTQRHTHNNRTPLQPRTTNPPVINNTGRLNTHSNHWNRNPQRWNTETPFTKPSHHDQQCRSLYTYALEGTAPQSREDDQWLI